MSWLKRSAYIVLVLISIAMSNIAFAQACIDDTDCSGNQTCNGSGMCSSAQVQSCNSGYYLSGNTCNACGSHVSSCLSPSQPLTCVSGYTFSGSSCVLVQTYHVTYNSNNATAGNVPSDATAYNSGDTVTVASNSGNLVRNGYTFAGWNTLVNGSGSAYIPGSDTFSINANTTLYAAWIPALCVAGTFSATGSSPCTNAPAGTYISLVGQTSPTNCPAGKFNPSVGSTTVTDCQTTPAGSYSPAGASSATACAIGYFSSGAGSTSCSPAPIGFYVGTTGASSATPCLPGYFSNTTGGNSCTAAPAGYYVSTGGATLATACSLGYFSSNTASLTCTIAPAGTYVSTLGSTSATTCANGFTSNAGSSTCSPIVVNGTCGSAANVASIFIPTGAANLCSAGSESSVANASPWTWSCTGANNGTTAQCSAPTGATATSSGSTRAVLTGSTWAVQYGLNNISNLPNTAGTIGTSGNAKSPGTTPPGVTFPHGLYDFTLTGGNPNVPATVVLTYPSPLPAGTVYWKYGKSPTSNIPAWYQFPGAVISNDRLSITLTLTDGALGDDDGQANGTITDPGGPGFGGGTDVSGVPTLSAWALIALTGLVGLLGLGYVRRRQSF